MKTQALLSVLVVLNHPLPRSDPRVRVRKTHCGILPTWTLDVGRRALGVAPRSAGSTPIPYPPLPNGLKIRISLGRRVRAANSATVIANPVRTPKSTLGMKFESTNIEKPTIIVTEV